MRRLLFAAIIGFCMVVCSLLTIPAHAQMINGTQADFGNGFHNGFGQNNFHNEFNHHPGRNFNGTGNIIGYNLIEPVCPGGRCMPEYAPGNYNLGNGNSMYDYTQRWQITTIPAPGNPPTMITMLMDTETGTTYTLLPRAGFPNYFFWSPITR